MAETAHHPHVVAYLDALRSAGKTSTAAIYMEALARLGRWLAAEGIAFDRATADDLARFQRWLAESYRSPAGRLLARSTQATVIVIIRSAFRWMRRRNLILHDPAATLRVPKFAQALTVAKDHLGQQEAVALVETLVALVDEATGATSRALALRNLALISLALATGRRCHGLTGMRVDQLDLGRQELRVEHEKGKTGRVLPVAEWAIAAVRRYLADARTHLLRDRTSDYLFVSQRRGTVCHKAVEYLLRETVAKTIRRNPDLVELTAKNITTHSLRVSFATLIFQGGINIRSLNELMLHSSLTTTARYTPIALQDLRQAMVAAHPRA